jgi:hypothetical protein
MAKVIDHIALYQDGSALIVYKDGTKTPVAAPKVESYRQQGVTVIPQAQRSAQTERKTFKPEDEMGANS